MFTCEGRLSVGEEAAALGDLHRRLVQAVRVQVHGRAARAAGAEREVAVEVAGGVRVERRVAQHPPQLVLTCVNNTQPININTAFVCD